MRDLIVAVDIGTGSARRTGFRFRPDERQAVNRPCNGNGNIQRAVLGKGCRSGGNRIGHCFPAVIHRNGRESGRFDNHSDGKILVFRIAACDLDGRCQAYGREHLPRMVCGKDVFPERLADCVGILLYVNRGLPTRDNLSAAHTFCLYKNSRMRGQ